MLTIVRERDEPVARVFPLITTGNRPMLATLSLAVHLAAPLVALMGIGRPCGTYSPYPLDTHQRFICNVESVATQCALVFSFQLTFLVDGQTC